MFLPLFRDSGGRSADYRLFSIEFQLHTNSKYEMEGRFLLRALVSSPFGVHNNVKLVERKMVNEVCCLYHELTKEVMEG